MMHQPLLNGCEDGHGLLHVGAAIRQPTLALPTRHMFGRSPNRQSCCNMQLNCLSSTRHAGGDSRKLYLIYAATLSVRQYQNIYSDNAGEWIRGSIVYAANSLREQWLRDGDALSKIPGCQKSHKVPNAFIPSRQVVSMAGSLGRWLHVLSRQPRIISSLPCLFDVMKTTSAPKPS